jgi:transcriptional regulator with XRE-family HTH domain
MDMTDKDYRCITKSELADKCGISRSTLSIWLNCRYYVELERLGYKKRQRILLPLQVKFLFEILVIIEE